jgi:tRNA(fMet)-specific endonuclease VapC
VISILDTSAFSAAMRREPGMIAFLRARQPGDVATVPPVVAEIEYGVQATDAPSAKRSLLEAEKGRLLGVVKVLPWTDTASKLFGTLKAALERDGTPLDDFDTAVAALALSHDARLVTAEPSRFARIAGLSCGHWSERAAGDGP